MEDQQFIKGDNRYSLKNILFFFQHKGGIDPRETIGFFVCMVHMKIVAIHMILILQHLNYKSNAKSNDIFTKNYISLLGISILKPKIQSIEGYPKTIQFYRKSWGTIALSEFLGKIQDSL